MGVSACRPPPSSRPGRLIERNVPTVGADVVALGMSVIIGDNPVGPVFLKAALTGSDGDSQGPDSGAFAGPCREG